MSKAVELTLYTPHEKQLEIHQSSARFKVLNWGRRTGKSVFAINHTLIEAMKRPGRYWIVAPTYRQAKNIYWLEVIPQSIPKEVIQKKNEQESTVHLINGSVIELKGADNQDSLRGAGIKGLILDEYAFMSPTVWETILRPTLVDSGGWAVFISTPKGFNHFYDLVEYASNHDNYLYSHATSYDNPHIPNNEVDDLKADYLAKGREDEFYQEYMAEFRKMTGLVYKQFDRKIHVVDPKEVPEYGSHILGIDFGYTNPLAAVFVLVDKDDNWWIYDEVYDKELVTEQAVNIIQTKMGTNRFTSIIGDSAAAQEISNYNNAGLPVKPCNKTKDSIMSGIRTISDKLKVLEGTGKPKLFISSNCKNIIFEFEAYHYPEEREDRNASEMPIKENDHALDALRYLALSVHNTNRATVYKPAFYRKNKK
jgi:phage terminase large subunit